MHQLIRSLGLARRLLLTALYEFSSVNTYQGDQTVPCPGCYLSKVGLSRFCGSPGPVLYCYYFWMPVQLGVPLLCLAIELQASSKGPDA